MLALLIKVLRMDLIRGSLEPLSRVVVCVRLRVGGELATGPAQFAAASRPFQPSATVVQPRTDSNHRAGCRLVEANATVEFRPLDGKGAYAFAARTLTRLGYRALDKPSKELVKPAWPRPRATRVPSSRGSSASIAKRPSGGSPGRHRPFACAPACALLARVDADLGQMSGLETRVVLHGEFHVFGDRRFERLAGPRDSPTAVAGMVPGTRAEPRADRGGYRASSGAASAVVAGGGIRAGGIGARRWRVVSGPYSAAR